MTSPAPRADKAPLWVALFAILLYLPAIGGGFVHDDGRAILGHPSVTGDAPMWQVFVREFWGGHLSAVDWSSSYRPLTTLTFAIEHRLTTSPWLAHLVNALLYGGLCAQVTWLCRRFARPPVALAIGLVFAALPIHVESVASVVGRADVLASMAALGAFALAVPSDGTPPPWRRALAAALVYFAALLFKETVAILPALVGWFALLSLVRGGAEARARWRAVVLPTVVLAVVGAAYLIARQQLLAVELPPDFIAADNQLMDRAGVWRAWGNLAVLGHYAELTAVPLRLCADHSYGDAFPPTELFGHGAAWAWLGLPLLVAMIADGVRALLGKSRGMWFALLLSYVLVGQWVITLSIIVAERLALWPTVWLMLAVAASANVWAERVARRRAAGLIAVLLALLGARSVDRSLDWRSDVELQASSIEACPAAVHARVLLAASRSRAGEHEEALWHYAVAAAGRSAFPAPFDSPLLDAEDELPLAERLARLPELVGASDRVRYYAALHDMLRGQGALAEAALVRRLATEPAPSR